MAQGVLPFKYEVEKISKGMTGMAGLPLYLDLFEKVGLRKAIEKNVNVRSGSQGWTDVQMITSLVLLNLAGGDCVDDIDKLESDEGFCEVLKKAELHGLSRKERRKGLRRWRKEKKRSFPSQSAIFRYLWAFHDKEQEPLREKGKAFIPASNEHFRGLTDLQKHCVGFLNHHDIQTTATLDMDATLDKTNKAEAFFCYKGWKAYQPLNTYWAEHGIVLHTEFRDGNVPAGHEQLRVFKEALSCLPKEVKEVKLRSDTAGYQHELLRYCANGANERFGVIKFAIGCDVTSAFKKAVYEVSESEWKPIYKEYYGRKYETGSQWAEVCFVPNALSHSKKSTEYRYIAKRQVLSDQKELPGMEQQLPFPSMGLSSKKYKIFGVVTNRKCNGEEVIHWLHERCGKSEEVHSVMKTDLAGGKLPSGYFGENAAWWQIMTLSLNLNVIMKKLGFGKEWEPKRMKAIRYAIINLPGRIVSRARSLSIRLSKKNPAFEFFKKVRKRLAMLCPAPAG